MQVQVKWEWRSALMSLLVLSVMTGVVFPLVITGLAQLLFPEQANGSLLRDRSGRIIGSALIGQPFQSPGYFWSRPSATSGFPYNAFDAKRGSGSLGSNRGPLHPEFLKAVQERESALRALDPGKQSLVPIDLVTFSASGLDPHISPASAYFQMGRVAKARGIDLGRLQDLVKEFTEERTFEILGEPVVNVLKLNLALDALR